VEVQLVILEMEMVLTIVTQHTTLVAVDLVALEVA
jgi:hypothetical protein